MIKLVMRPKQVVIKSSSLKLDDAIVQFRDKFSRELFCYTYGGNSAFSYNCYKSLSRPKSSEPEKTLLYSVEVHERGKHGMREYVFNYHIIEENILRYFCKEVKQHKRFYKLTLK